MEIKINGTTYTMSTKSYEDMCEGARLWDEARRAEAARQEAERHARG